MAIESHAISYYNSRLVQYIVDNLDEEIDTDDTLAGWTWAMEFIQGMIDTETLNHEPED